MLSEPNAKGRSPFSVSGLARGRLIRRFSIGGTGNGGGAGDTAGEHQTLGTWLSLNSSADTLRDTLKRKEQVKKL